MKKITDQKIKELTDEMLNDLVRKIQETTDHKDQHGQGDIWGLYCSHDWDDLVSQVAEYMTEKKNQIEERFWDVRS